MCIGLIAAIEWGILFALASRPSQGSFLEFDDSFYVIVGGGFYAVTVLLPYLLIVVGRRWRFFHILGLCLLGIVGAGWVFLFAGTLQDFSVVTASSLALGVLHVAGVVILYEPREQ